MIGLVYLLVGYADKAREWLARKAYVGISGKEFPESPCSQTAKE